MNEVSTSAPSEAQAAKEKLEGSTSSAKLARAPRSGTAGLGLKGAPSPTHFIKVEVSPQAMCPRGVGCEEGEGIVVVSLETWEEARAWTPSLVHFGLWERRAHSLRARGVCVYSPGLTGRAGCVTAGGGGNRGEVETAGLCPKWGLGDPACAPLMEMQAGGPESWPGVCQGVSTT